MRALNKIIFLSFCFSILLSGNAFASWHKDDTGFWWDNGDGSYPAGKWQWIDGNQDGTAECYYFDDKGYMLENTVTPDLYTVDESGAWTVDGVVQKRITESEFRNETFKNMGESAAVSTVTVIMVACGSNPVGWTVIAAGIGTSMLYELTYTYTKTPRLVPDDFIGNFPDGTFENRRILTLSKDSKLIFEKGTNIVTASHKNILDITNKKNILEFSNRINIIDN